MRSFARTLLPSVALVALLLPSGTEAQNRGQSRGPSRQRIDTTFAFSKNGELSIAVGGGEIRVTGWARNDARIIATGERGVISMDIRSNRVRLDVQPLNLGRAQFEINVPIGVRVSVSGRSADIDVSGTQGELALTTVSGRITASDGTGRSRISTAAGTVELQRFSGETVVGSMTGRLTINEINGSLSLNTITAPTTIERADLTSISADAAQGNIDFSGRLDPEGKHRLETFGGNIELRFPADFAATIEMESHNGKLHAVDFPVTMRSRPGSTGRSADQQYTINGGGTLINISTMNGGVFLRKLAAPNRR